MHLFEGRTANDVWLQAAIAIKEQPTNLTQPSRAGNTRELQDVMFSIADPRRRWISCRLPPLNPAFAIAEVVWIINGRNDSAFLNFWNPILPRFQGRVDKYPGAYGWRLRTAFGFDQIEQAYHALRSNPATRQVVLQIWDPRVDLPFKDGQPRSEDVPCNISSMLKVREDRLEWTQVMRSNDLIRGFPHNVVQFTYLHELMAAWLGLELGAYTHLSDSLHVYEEQIQELDTLGSELPDFLPEHWNSGYAETMEIFKVMAEEMDLLRCDATRLSALQRLIEMNLPGPARNMLLTVGSDAARRKGHADIARDLMGDITDPFLRPLLELWYRRQGFEFC